MHAPDPVLLAALRAAPRRYRMPPLPVDAQAARARGTDTALAFAIEAARLARERGRPAPPEAKSLFTWALAAFIGEALRADGGDPAYQALLLQAQHAEVREFAQLSVRQPVDRRALRLAIDALAHPGKLRALPDGAGRDALARLHALAVAADWLRLHEELETLARDPRIGGPALEAIAASPALGRLLRLGELRALAPVQHYLVLCARRGPLAGSPAAAAQGRASARLGDDAEQATVDALLRVASLLQARQAHGSLRVVRSLHTPRGFPGAAAKAKSEWDAAIVCGHREADGADLWLLAEVKASAAAATPDFPRLQRGLLRLAQADPARSHRFLCDQGEVRIAGASLQALRPPAGALPPHVVYCCTAAPETEVQVLAAASKAVLAAEPASLAFAQRLARAESPPADALAPVWEALASAPRLRATLHQYETAQAVREAMLHPDDLLAAVHRSVAGAA